MAAAVAAHHGLWCSSAAVAVVLLSVAVVVLRLALRAKGSSFRLVGRVEGLLYLVRGPQLIDRAYDAAGGRAFKVATPSNDHLCVTSKELIKELAEAPLQTLSLHAVAKEMLQPRYTMHGFEWRDQRGAEGTGFVRALRSLLTSNLPGLQPDLERLLSTSLAAELGAVGDDGYSHARLFPLVKRTVTRANCFVFFGRELSHFTAAALEFPQAVVFAAELLRITPGPLRPLVAALATRRHRAARTLFRHLAPVVKQWLAARGREGSVPGAARTDCMQWLVDTSPRRRPWSPARMVGEIMAVWFGSVHQLAMLTGGETTTYAIEDLCLHPEYVEPLRDEARRLFLAPGASRDVDRLPLLDSFVRESIRCTSSDAITGRRKALAPYVFGDGSALQAGDWVCVPQRAMMGDGARYRDAGSFDGFRFARANAELRRGVPTAAVPDGSEGRLTDAGADWPIWGFGKTACPGRFYAALVTKLILLLVLDRWECRLREPAAPRTRVWRSSVVPRQDTIVMFRARE